VVQLLWRLNFARHFRRFRGRLDLNRTLRHAEIMAARLFLRIDFEPSHSALGPGMAQLLERVVEHGSIRAAAVSMDMSYRKAWLLIHEMQETFNGAIVTSAIGGAAGGGTQLTELGSTLLKIYRRVESRAAHAAEADLAALDGMVRANAKPRRTGRRKPVSKSA
jgi:molybdate transport system regulatory protein